MMIPLNVSFMDWAHSLIVDFPTDNVPSLTNEDDWQLWGTLLIESQSFASNGAPSTYGYSDKFAWARDLFSTMNNY